jgi:alkyl hydroperoxide reductase subunit AhpC
LKPKSEGGLAPLNIPLLSDISKKISKNYHVLVCNENDGLNGISLRGTFIIDDKGILRHSSVNDAPVGRNVDEILRLLKAFQFTDKHGEVCPAKWEPGKKTVIFKLTIR